MKPILENTKPEFSFVSICQKGDLEIKTILLIMSLRKKLKCNYEIIVAIPEMYGVVQEPSDAIMNMLRRLNVRIEYFRNEYCLDRGNELEGDWFSNKAYCLGLKFNGKKIIFLDSDMFLMREFIGEERFFSANFNAKQARYSHIKDWSNLYKIVGLEQPNNRYQCDADGIYIPAYFNSGFFAIDNELAKDLGKTWLEVFEKVTMAGIVPTKMTIRRNQISLAIAVQLMNISYEVMDDSFNFPVGDKVLNSFVSPFIVHYHHVSKIINVLPIKNLINSFCTEWDDLRIMLEEDPEWKVILE